MNTIPQQFKQDPIFNRVGEVARLGTPSWNLCDAYNQSLKIYRDNYAIAATEGRAEGHNDVARNLIGMGMDDKFIEQAIGLSKEEISILRSSTING